MLIKSGLGSKQPSENHWSDSKQRNLPNMPLELHYPGEYQMAKRAGKVQQLLGQKFDPHRPFDRREQQFLASGEGGAQCQWIDAPHFLYPSTES